jgi:hypothetical protein
MMKQRGQDKNEGQHYIKWGRGDEIMGWNLGETIGITLGKKNGE